MKPTKIAIKAFGYDRVQLAIRTTVDATIGTDAKYIRCSTARSRITKKLEVGASNKKNALIQKPVQRLFRNKMNQEPRGPPNGINAMRISDALS